MNSDTSGGSVGNSLLVAIRLRVAFGVFKYSRIAHVGALAACRSLL